MDSGIGVAISAGCAIVLIGIGGLALLKVPTRHGQTESTNQILKKLAFQDIQKTKKELDDYFYLVISLLTKANFCFSVAFVVLSLTVKVLNKDQDMNIFQAMGRILPFALIPILISAVAKHQVMRLRSDCTEKLNEK